MTIRAALGVWTPLCVALSVGGLAGIATVSGLGRFGLDLSDRVGAFPVIAFVVVFGFRGAVGSANRLALLLRSQESFHPSVRR